ncbi:GNAT family N-acetyltransferase [Pseudomonas sp. TMW22091]|uniref:GNAT family N-acetyltransferase n=1 Tax=Pseudomonas sp. TMW22091 TaxID=2506435 RepID=UPI001F1161C0|nr:GNAT family N-acetyltransferase [Pseudomonas sp. TMW22091]MCH4871769.1 GNAT family N-acetyltransferase [Pseudomonas sp. TMW22091]
MSAYSLLLRKDLREPLLAVRWPDDVTLATLKPQWLPQAHALLDQAYSGGMGSIESIAHWQHALVHDAEYDPQLCFALLRNGQVIAFAQAWTSAFLKDLIVHPDHQRRGLGDALLSHVFAVFEQRREACVDLKVMEHNHTALCLYQKHGMTVVQRERVL